MKKEQLIIGTRGSTLARIQAQMVKEKISEVFPEFEIRLKIIKTKGDHMIDSPLYAIGDKGLFVKEIDQELIAGSIDIAVHSLKDVPGEIPHPLTIGAVLERGEVRDVLLSGNKKKIGDLPRGARVATSSLRRRAQLIQSGFNINIIDIRGNIDTRIKKMEDSYCDAVVLAGAGVIRAGYNEKISEFFDPEIMIPAAGQGIIGITVKKDMTKLRDILNSINCKNTMISARSERVFLHALQGGCKIPIGCISTIIEDRFTIKGFLADVNGSVAIKKELQGPKKQSTAIARTLAEQILSNGGLEILAEIRKGNHNDY